MTRILGIDPGLATMGFGCIDATDASITPVDFGIVSTPPKQPVADRLLTLYSDLSELLTTLQPEWLGLEKFFFYRMGNTIQVAQARGVILLALRHYSPLEPQEFTPAQIKQTLTGYGNADKQAVQAAVVRDLHLERPPQPDDAADGLAIALTVWHHRHTRKI